MWRAVRIISPLQTSPFLLNLNLKPLYSILGGSTILADPLIKYPANVVFRLKPLYNWKACSHLTLVLSDIESQVSLKIKFFVYFFF